MSKYEVDNPFDTSNETVTDAKDPAIKRLVELAGRAVVHTEIVADLERNLNEAKQHLRQMKTVELPDLMAECGLSEFKHAETGAKLKVESFVSGSLPKEPDKRQAAIEELNRIGGEAIALLKTTVVLTFDKKQHNQALALVADLTEAGYEPKIMSDIHPQTLMAFGRECLRKGVNAALDKLGLYSGKTTDIKLPDGK